MKRQTRFNKSPEDDLKSYDDNIFQRISRNLEKMGLSESVSGRYSNIVSYSNQIDYMNISFLCQVIKLIYINSENRNSIDIEYFVKNILHKKTGVKESDYREMYLKFVLTSIRYIDHFFICLEKADVISLQEAKDVDGGDIDDKLFNEFDFYES